MVILNKLIAVLKIKRKISLAQSICKNYDVKLTHNIDPEDVSVVFDVFLNRVYGVCFPFNEDSVIVDIGAHKGFFSIYADRYSGKNSIIYSLEPELSNYEKLIANLRLNNCSKVQPINVGVSDKTGKEKLYIGNSVNHSFITIKDKILFFLHPSVFEVIKAARGRSGRHRSNTSKTEYLPC